MHVHSLEDWRHDHGFTDHDRAGENQRRVAIVIGLTIVAMVAEIGAGIVFNSMALLADGWHMGSHAAALSIALFAIWYARKHAADAGYTFGTGKVASLGGFASAIVLLIVGLLMAWESFGRLLSPLPIGFDEAMTVAVLGLIVNLASAWLLKDRDHHNHHHGEREHGHGHDHNMRAAYLHVLADALTSILAIVALLAGKTLGWTWTDPVAGMVGAAVIGWWSYGLLRESGRVLLDGAIGRETCLKVRRAIEEDADNRVVDLHLWRVGPGKVAAIVSLVTHYPRPPEHYRALLARMDELVHVTVEINTAEGEPCVLIER